MLRPTRVVLAGVVVALVVASGPPLSVLTPSLLAEMYAVDAEIAMHDGRSVITCRPGDRSASDVTQCRSPECAYGRVRPCWPAPRRVFCARSIASRRGTPLRL